MWQWRTLSIPESAPSGRVTTSAGPQTNQLIRRALYLNVINLYLSYSADSSESLMMSFAVYKPHNQEFIHIQMWLSEHNAFVLEKNSSCFIFEEAMDERRFGRIGAPHAFFASIRSRIASALITRTNQISVHGVEVLSSAAYYD